MKNVRSEYIYLIVIAILASYILTIIYLPWTGYHRESTLTITCIVVGTLISLIGIILVRMAKNLPTTHGTRVRGGWVEPFKGSPQNLGVAITSKHQYDSSNNLEPPGRINYRLLTETRRRSVIRTYFAVTATFVTACLFSYIGLFDALSNWWEILIVFGIFSSPFLIRRFTQGFMVIGIYYLIVAVFSMTFGTWQTNTYGSGVIIFFTLGLSPYIFSKILLPVYRSSGHMVFD